MGQKAFYFDMKKCAGCHACEIACRDRNALYNVGELFRKVDLYEGGKFPKPWMYILSIACNHCAKPACVANCPTGAMYKDADTGLVLHDDALCIGCGTCVQTCPYHEPILMEKEGKTVAAKCDGCYALVKEGKNPVCVDACNSRVLEFGELTDIMKAHPDAVQNIRVLPDASETVPAFFIDATKEAVEEEPTQVF